ncbi:WbqC family protein [Streptomyces sp. NPDC091377]|uniref:WbqC family protein n=1 Tax=Streptomyces sp. NPDC091377 TaxID=3365995 RepID=UPI00382CF64D
MSAHQPAYLPWLGYFGKIAGADLFVLHDRSPIGRRNGLNSNVILTANGPLTLTVPLSGADVRSKRPLDEIRVVDDGWRRRHWRALQTAYGRAPYFDLHRDFLADYYTRDHETLDAVCIPVIEYCAAAFGLSTPLRRLSELGLPPVDRQTVIPALCERFGARRFLAGPHAADYLDWDLMKRHGLTVDLFHYRHPTYPQMHRGSATFVSHLSALDLLMNCGPRAADLLKGSVG